MGLPVYMYSVLGWGFMQVGGYLAAWVIGYGFVQAAAPKLLRTRRNADGPDGATARHWALLLALVPAAIALALMFGVAPVWSLMIGLALFGIVFAINSALHSYLILVYSNHDKVALNVGFYYMANAGGRLAGTVLSGGIYQMWGLTGCLWWSVGFVLAAALLSFALPVRGGTLVKTDG